MSFSLGWDVAKQRPNVGCCKESKNGTRSRGSTEETETRTTQLGKTLTDLMLEMLVVNLKLLSCLVWVVFSAQAELTSSLSFLSDCVFIHSFICYADLYNAHLWLLLMPLIQPQLKRMKPRHKNFLSCETFNPSDIVTWNALIIMTVVFVCRLCISFGLYLIIPVDAAGKPNPEAAGADQGGCSSIYRHNSLWWADCVFLIPLSKSASVTPYCINNILTFMLIWKFGNY